MHDELSYFKISSAAKLRKNFARAAQSLHLAQPALTKNMQALEEKPGAQSDLNYPSEI